jgi:cell division septum initiation protein DivIVA|tara:strand:- start:17993 stop:18574 length:582 start_codon:yes stop_codon:yes gene_type:complete
MTNEVEYKGIKIRGGKLLLILPLLGTLGGALWAGFEGYARWVAMEEKIDKYVAPDLSGFNLKLDVLEERITSLETNTSTEMSAVKELVGAAQDDARTIRTDLRSDVHDVHDQIAAVDRRSRTMEQEIRTSIRTSENDIRSLIQHAEDRFDGKRTAIESDAQRRIETIDIKLKELEDRLRTMLERALNNPLAGQ